MYCLCKTPYDALRPMISCDKCEGWFHYDCCGMAPPTEEEPEDPDIHFTCPPCCKSNGSKYKPFRPLPVKKQRGSSSEERGDEKADAEAIVERSEEDIDAVAEALTLGLPISAKEEAKKGRGGGQGGAGAGSGADGDGRKATTRGGGCRHTGGRHETSQGGGHG